MTLDDIRRTYYRKIIDDRYYPNQMQYQQNRIVRFQCRMAQLIELSILVLCLMTMLQMISILPNVQNSMFLVGQ
jgi:hypothetical protein